MIHVDTCSGTTKTLIQNRQFCRGDQDNGWAMLGEVSEEYSIRPYTNSGDTSNII